MLNPNDNRRWYNGECGNLSVSPTFEGNVSAASGATIDICKLEPNIKVIGVRVHSDALGASTTLTFKVGSTALTKAITTSAEVSSEMLIDDYLSADGDVLSVLVGGGAVSGKLRVKVVYEMVGNL